MEYEYIGLIDRELQGKTSRKEAKWLERNHLSPKTELLKDITGKDLSASQKMGFSQEKGRKVVWSCLGKGIKDIADIVTLDKINVHEDLF